MKNVSVNVDAMQFFVIISNVGIKIKCRCKCKELIDKGICHKGFIWNPSICECECDKNCDVGEYLDYENCKCRTKLVDKLSNECTENIGTVKLAEITLAKNENNYKCSFCTVYIVLMIVFFYNFYRNYYS